MPASEFEAILRDLVAAIPGARVAAIVDLEGETVDYTGPANPFEIRLAAAHLHIVLSQLAPGSPLGSPRTILIRAARKTLLVHALPDDYAIIVVLVRGAGFVSTRRALAACERAIAHEAGWQIRPEAALWHPALVDFNERQRPIRVSDASRMPPRWRAIEVIGTVRDTTSHTPVFRIRVESGAELTLVRESRKRWYTDECLDAHSQAQTPSRSRDRCARKKSLISRQSEAELFLR